MGFSARVSKQVALFKAGLLRGTIVLYLADDRATLAAPPVNHTPSQLISSGER